MVRTGLDVAIDRLGGAPVPAGLEAAAELLRGGRLGLVTNPSAVTADLVAAPDALRAAGARLAALFGPEHGVRGDVADGVRIPHGVDARTEIPLWSLYGETSAPTEEMLAGLDALVFDIQDVGARFYTYSSTLSHVMRAADGAGLPVIVLDRPNPLGGEQLEGPMLEPEHASFVGLHPIPIRHGATIGELGRLWTHFGVSRTEPLVVPCVGWSRSALWEETGLQWIPPSPAMPAPEPALLYPGMCLLEGTNVSEGRGTACPFRWFGAPWVDPEGLADRLNGEGLPGVRFRPVRFSPTASKFRGETCAGCQVHVLDAQAFRPVATGVAVLSALRHGYPDSFTWRENAGRYSVDRLAGTRAVREAIDAGRTWQQISEEWTPAVEAYRLVLGQAALY
jgi:uncharacterized protein YbbC (DUF1343 family)